MIVRAPRTLGAPMAFGDRLQNVVWPSSSVATELLETPKTSTELDVPIPADRPLVPFPLRASSDSTTRSGAAGAAAADTAPPELSDTLASAPDSQNIVHDVLKSLDVWFNIEVCGLEKNAVQQAHSWAEHGLPRHDLEPHAPLDVEQVLAGRATEIYWSWIRKARRRVTGAIGRELRTITEAINDAVSALESYKTIECAVNDLRPSLSGHLHSETSLDAADSPHPTALVKRQLHRWFWPLSIGLVVCEFIANVPVFRELFPSNIEIERRVNEWLANDGGQIWWAGLKKVLVELSSAPEPALVALGIVVFFLFLGHKVGEGCRTMVAVIRQHTGVPDSIRRQLIRHAAVVIAAGAVGLLIALVVLYNARATVLPMAGARLTAATERLASAKADLDAAKQADDPVKLDRARNEVWAATDDQLHRTRRKDYATSLDRMNWAITGLNVVLAIVATIAGYFRHEVTLDDGEVQTSAAEAKAARAMILRSRDERLAMLRSDLASRRSDLHASLSLAELAYARAQQLVQCDPTAQWEAVAERLACVVRSFRAENARMRHLDTRDIRAFHAEPPELNTPQPPAEELPTHVAELIVVHRRKLGELAAAYDRIASVARSGRRSGEEEAA
jgi:hypothetical protein